MSGDTWCQVLLESVDSLRRALFRGILQSKTPARILIKLLLIYQKEKKKVGV